MVRCNEPTRALYFPKPTEYGSIFDLKFIDLRTEWNKSDTQFVFPHLTALGYAIKFVMCYGYFYYSSVVNISVYGMCATCNNMHKQNIHGFSMFLLHFFITD